MTGDPDVLKLAELLIRQDGEDAADVAERRAARLLSSNDRAGYRTWSEVARTIAHLQQSGETSSIDAIP
jgi:sirohydrochlorin ferrochelatase